MQKKLTNFELIFIIAAIIKVLGLIYKLLLSRILTIEGMRIVSMILPTLSLMLSLSSFSISTVVNQNCASKAESTKTILKSALNITFVTSTIISLVLLFSFPIYSKIYETSFIYFPLVLCIPLIYFSNISGIIKGYLEANNKHTVSYISNILEQIAKFVLTFLLLYIFKNKSLNFKILITFLSLMISEIFSFVYLVLKLNKKYSVKDLRLKPTGFEKSILKQATPLTIEQLLMTLTAYIEPLLFYYAMSLNDIDLYSSTIYYTQVSSYAIPLIIFTKFAIISIAKFSLPLITKNRKTNKLETILKNDFLIALSIGVLNFTICIFYTEDALFYLYNDTSSLDIVKTLTPFVILSFFNPIFIVILEAFKEEKKILISTLISSFIFLILIVPLTYFYNVNGYLFSIIITYILKFLLLFLFTYKHIKIPFRTKEIIFILALIFFYLLINLVFKNLIILVLSTIPYGLLILYLFWKNNKPTNDR